MACRSEKSPGSRPRPELWASPSQPELEKPMATCLHPSPAHRTRASQEAGSGPLPLTASESSLTRSSLACEPLGPAPKRAPAKVRRKSEGLVVRRIHHGAGRRHTGTRVLRNGTTLSLPGGGDEGTCGHQAAWGLPSGGQASLSRQQRAPPTPLAVTLPSSKIPIPRAGGSRGACHQSARVAVHLPPLGSHQAPASRPSCLTLR